MIGARLKQARLLAGLSQKELAARLRERDYPVTAAAISKYEKRKSVPPAQFLLLASDELGVLSTYFSHCTASTVEWKSFRRHSKLGKKQQEAVKNYAADLAELHIELHSMLHPSKSAILPSAVSVNDFTGAEKVADNLRKQWKLDDRPLDNLIQTLEDRGVVVIGWDESDQFDGLSGWCGNYPVAVINTGKSADRTRFSLAHEIGHLLMDTSAVSPKMEEKLAHRFAAALLVPEQHAFDELGSRRDQIDWPEIMMLKRKYGLSMSAWLARARDLGIISENRYSTMIMDFSKRGWRRNEPECYRGDEAPIQLKQMASRAISEGLISPNRVSSVAADLLDSTTSVSNTSEYPNAIELLEMDEDKRDFWMSKMFDLAKDMEFESFDDIGEEAF